MTENEIEIWTSTIKNVLRENEEWDDKNASERYHVVFEDIKMPPKVVLARAFNHIEEKYPELELKSVGGGVPTNQFLEEFGFKITEDLLYNNTDFKKLKKHFENKISNKKLFQEFVNFGYSVLSDLNIEVYKVRMAIEAKGILSVIVGMRAAYSYSEKDGSSQIGFLVSKDFKEQNKAKYNFVYDYSYKGSPKQDFIKIKCIEWSEIDDELLREHREQFRLQYEEIKNSKRTQWNVEAKTTNNAFKYILFKNENIDDFMNGNTSEKIINIGNNKLYKLSMGIFYKNTQFKKADYLKVFEDNKWAVMHNTTGAGQGESWTQEVKSGDFAYITFGKDKLSYLIRFNSEPQNLPTDINLESELDGYTYRSYDIIKKPVIANTKKITADRRFWLPSGNSTLRLITDLNKANKILFKPYYDVTITNNGNIIGNEDKGFKEKPDHKTPLNQILYGPPGTGKTYETISTAISIVDPDFFKANENNRKALVSKFKELTISNWTETSGQIAFCTFHQSFTYEDFVEGIKPKVVNDTDIIYENQKGVFKALCDRARTATNDTSDFDTVISKLQNDILENGVVTLQTNRGNKFDVNYTGQTTFRIKPHESTQENPQYPAAIENIRMLYEGAPLTDVYNPSYVKGILEHLFGKYGLSEFEEVKDNDKPYVIIIDEINRGNVAAIFGELITLIEVDKRAGAEEELSVILPYSKKEFKVPNNVYIIGTMNTADRSVEALDSALRRRFSFKEIMPKYDVIQNHLKEKNNWNEIEVHSILEKINKRITRLIDRDHQIGHSYFLKLTDASGQGFTQKLKNIFSENIIPLLQEYFFNDFNKIGLVIGKDFLQPVENDENIFADFPEGDSANYEDDIFEIIDPIDMGNDKFISAIKTLIN